MTIAIGLVVNGVTTYGFLSVSRHALGEEAYGGLAVLWAMTYVLGPGLFQPLEQEVARATAHRASRGVGSAPVLRRAAQIGAVELGLVVVALVIAWPLGLDSVLDDRLDLLLALLFALVVFAGAELVRGVLAGRHEFTRYSRYFAAEGTSRLFIAVSLSVLGVSVVGTYGLALGAGFAVATAAGVGRDTRFVRPGPPAELRELTPALGLLLATSLSEAFMLNIGVVAIEILSDDELAAGVFLNGLIISRIPLFFFQAVKAALLPHLAGLAAKGDLRAFRNMQLEIVGAVVAMAGLGVAGMWLVGPNIVETLFDGDQIGRRDMALLGASGGGIMIMLSLALGLVALGHTRLAATGWIAGVLTFGPALLLADDPFLRVELALVVSLALGIVITAVLLRFEYSAHTLSEEVPTVSNDSGGVVSRSER